MQQDDAATIYIRLRKRVRLRPLSVVRLGDIARILADEPLMPQLYALPIVRLRREDGSHLVIDIADIVNALRSVNAAWKVELLGDPEVIVEQGEPGRKPPWIAVAAVWFLLFVGSGLAIMNFHTDVAMKEVHARIYFLLTGEKSAHPYILQIPYAIGIGFGMALFFNHFFKKRLSDEPSPLEVEMFLYQQNVDRYFIAKERRKDRHDPVDR